MKIITLCGSTKFKKEFEIEQARLTLEGNIVLSVGMFGHEVNLDMNGDTKRMLDKLHFKKIDMSDEVFVINPGGYIGLSTCDEIYYAEAVGVPIKFLVKPIETRVIETETSIIAIPPSSFINLNHKNYYETKKK